MFVYDFLHFFLMEKFHRKNGFRHRIDVSDIATHNNSRESIPWKPFSVIIYFFITNLKNIRKNQIFGNKFFLSAESPKTTTFFTVSWIFFSIRNRDLFALFRDKTIRHESEGSLKRHQEITKFVYCDWIFVYGWRNDEYRSSCSFKWKFNCFNLFPNYDRIKIKFNDLKNKYIIPYNEQRKFTY